ncbi:hypothetical protein ACI3KX_12995 [Microbacterium sp. ZW CA_36]|uniref:hypothetical protein n=1 Tax=Microbacterium sp. ZW CA_36 TaxID=3378078 RepID=UPI003854D5CF
MRDATRHPGHASRLFGTGAILTFGALLAACSAAPAPDSVCTAGADTVKAISAALRNGLDASDPEQISTNLAELSEAVSHIDLDQANSPEQEALAKVRVAVESLVEEGKDSIEGAPSHIDESINSLIWTIGQLDEACDGGVLSSPDPL